MKYITWFKFLQFQWWLHSPRVINIRLKFESKFLFQEKSINEKNNVSLAYRTNDRSMFNLVLRRKNWDKIICFYVHIYTKRIKNQNYKVARWKQILSTIILTLLMIWISIFLEKCNQTIDKRQMYIYKDSLYWINLFEKTQDYQRIN